MEDKTGPQMWRQTILIATWWLAAVQGIKLFCVNGLDMDQTKKSK